MNSFLRFFLRIRQKWRIRQHVRLYCPQEFLLMRGKHISNSKNQSILFFTVHRCASQYIKSVFKQLTEGSTTTFMDIGSYLWKGGRIYSTSREIYKKHGYIYGPFYGMDKEELWVPIPNLNDFKVLLILRDPRDVLTSYYFHHLFEQYINPARQEFIKARSEKASRKTIDEWVCEMLPVFKGRYITYLEMFGKKPDVLLLRYEDMLTNFNNWLVDLVRFTNLKPSEKILNSIVKNANFSVKKEDVKSHKRQVTPGDHKRKLKKETIEIMNSELNEILKELNYT